jgi:muconolactone delta-isomerase
MGKYLYLWELDRTKIPVDAKERGVGLTMLLEMVKQDIKKGITKDWGAFAGEFNGYSVVEGTEVEILKQVQQYTPFVYFRTYPIASIAQIEEMIKSLPK